ncbi:MAG: glycoside hydrolase family 127 protein [Planctomycetales bacterium]|nr:glycoside hydrolase family 127 protein [Planctomycetales bacterium]
MSHPEKGDAPGGQMIPTKTTTWFRLAVALLVIGATPISSMAATAVVDTSTSPHAKLASVGVNEVIWTQGFWADRERVCRERTIPSMWGLMSDSRYKPFLEHFLIAAGKAEGDYHGAAWNDGDFYKWIEAACYSLAAHPDADLAAAVERSVAAVADAQRSDGYLHTPVLIRQRNGDQNAQPFADRHDFEVYNLGHLMTAGCAHFRVTGERALLTTAERAAQFLEGAFEDPTPQMARQSVCPSHYMGLIELYRTTHNPRYLRLAERVIDLRNMAAGVEGGGGDDNQDRIPFLQQSEAVGHAVRANYLYAGAADLYLETGDERLVEPLEAVWRNVTQKKLYVTGGCGALYDGASPDASPAQEQITRVHQAYGRNYQLPSITAHNETCAAIGALLWNWRRFLATGEARHVDLMELTLYNAILGGISLDGTEYFYVNPLRVVRNNPTEMRWSRRREPFIVSFCCPPNVARTVAQSSGYAYSVSKATLWVNLYGGNHLATKLDGDSIEITQETAYPWSGEITFRIKKAPSGPVTLNLRRPGWAESYTLSVNDAPVESGNSGGYLSLSRSWRSGDVVRLSFPMPVRLLESHPLVEETRNQLAVKRGPVVYCLESTDLPTGVRLEEVGLSAGAEFHSRQEDDLLSGVMTLEAELPVRDEPEWDSLYRPAREGSPRKVRCRLVPYYAWGNRGESEMSVWLPRR